MSSILIRAISGCLVLMVMNFSGYQIGEKITQKSEKAEMVKNENVNATNKTVVDPKAKVFSTIVYQGEGITEEELSIYDTVIRNQLSEKGFSDAKVFTSPPESIIVENIKTDNIQELAEEIIKPSKLEFKDCDGKVIIDSKDIFEASSELYSSTSIGAGDWAVLLMFSSEGAEKFAEATERISKLQNQNKNYISIYLNDKLLSSPMVSQRIEGGSAIIEGADFTAESTKEIAELIHSGNLTGKLKVKEIK